MIVDCHTHIWKAEHLSETFLQELRKIRGLGDAYKTWIEYGTRLENHFEAMKSVDKAVVLGLRCKEEFINVPNDYVAEYVNSHPEKLIGFGSVDPDERGAVKEVKRCVHDMGLRGLKLYPIAQHHPPNDRKYYPIYETAQELEIPILFHMGTGPMSHLQLKYSRPLLLEDVAMDFPDLKIIIAHMGHPWVEDAIVLIRKQPNLYADTSGLENRPYKSLYTGLVYAMEYGVLDKLLFGSDWPVNTPEREIRLLKNINVYTENTNLPRIPEEAIRCIIEENARKVLNL